MAIKALVTAGAAATFLDDVRYSDLLRVSGCGDVSQDNWHHAMTNIFRGAMGRMLAVELAARGVETKLLIRKDAAPDPGEYPELCVETFRSFEQLESGLEESLCDWQPDVVFMAAAPPDYAPVKIEGKRRSDNEELQITYRRTPKLIDRIRPSLGEEAVVVGFKLMVGVPEEELLAAASKQIARASTDFCIGNDLKLIDSRAGIHPVLLVTPDGEREAIKGQKVEVIKAFTSKVLSHPRLSTQH